VAEGSFGPDGKEVIGDWRKVLIMHNTGQILGRCHHGGRYALGMWHKPERREIHKIFL